TAPEGLLGLLSTRRRVRDVTARSSSAGVTLYRPAAGWTGTGVAPIRRTISGNVTQYGAGQRTSSPGSSRVKSAFQIACLAPFETTISFGSYRTPFSRASFAAIASRRAGTPATS